MVRKLSGMKIYLFLRDDEIIDATYKYVCVWVRVWVGCNSRLSAFASLRVLTPRRTI